MVKMAIALMTPVLTGIETPARSRVPFSWPTIGWVSALLVACYAPVLLRWSAIWYDDPDMGHGFFVSCHRRLHRLAKTRPDRGCRSRARTGGASAIMIWGGLQLYMATLGAELFLARTSLVISIIGAVLLLGGTRVPEGFRFPALPAVLHGADSGRDLQPAHLSAAAVRQPRGRERIGLLADSRHPRRQRSRSVAEQKLNVVEACSGIRSLLTLTFLSLVYGYFFEKRTWVRVVLFFSTIPIAIVANAGRVTLTGVVSSSIRIWPKDVFHEAQGWVIFMMRSSSWWRCIS